MTDKRKYQYKDCSAIMGTLTNAQKAQQALISAAIPAGVTKSEPSATGRGCIWSVNFSCNQAENVKTVLASSGIKVKSWSIDNDIFG